MSWLLVFLIALIASFLMLFVGFFAVKLMRIKTDYVFSASIVVAVLLMACFSLISPITGWSIYIVALEVIAILSIAFIFSAREDFEDGLNVKALKCPVCWGGVGAVCLFLFLALCLSGSKPTDVLQLYDAPFHLSIVRHIAETGNASPFGAGAVAGNATSIYPDVVHSISALFLPLVNNNIQTSIWVTEIIFVAIFFPIGSLELTRVLAKNHSWQPSMLKSPMATIAMLLPVILPLSVVSMLVWGPLYENAAGCAMLPAMLAILIERIDHLCDACSSRLQDVVVILLVFICAGFCHPNTCFTLGIFALPYALKKTHSLKMRLIILICAVSLWTFLFYSPFFKRTVNCNDRIHKGIEYGERLFSALHLDYSSISSNEFFVLLLFAVMLGVVVLVSSKLERKCSCGRYFFGLGFVAIMATMTLFPNTSTARFLTGFWYVDTIRFVFIFQCLVSSFIVAVIADLKRCLTLNKFVKFSTVSLFLVLTVVQLGYYAKNLDINKVNQESNIEVTFSEEDLEIFSSIHEIVGNDVVINGFYDCSLWSYALSGVNVTVKANVPNHLAATDVHLEEIMKNLSDLGNDEAYFEALRNTCKNLNYHYVLQVENESKMKLGIDDMGRWYLEDLGPNSVVEEGTKGFTKCGTWESPSGKMTLYRIEFD